MLGGSPLSSNSTVHRLAKCHSKPHIFLISIGKNHLVWHLTYFNSILFLAILALLIYFTTSYIFILLNPQHFVCGDVLEKLSLTQLTNAITWWPALCQWIKLISTSKFPMWRLLAVGSNPAYTHWVFAFNTSIISPLKPYKNVAQIISINYT